MVRLGQHPRIAHLVLKGREMGQGKVAALIAAILGERDFLRLPPGQRDADLRHRVDIALGGRRDGPLRLIHEAARRLMPRNAGDERPDIAMTGPLLALAYPDRIGRRRPGTAGRYLLSGGRGAVLSEGDPLANEEFLVVADLDGAAQEARIFLAAPITAAEIEDLYTDRILDEQLVQWSARDGAVLARQRRRLGRWRSRTSRWPGRMPTGCGPPCSTVCASWGSAPCRGATISCAGASASPSCAATPARSGPISPTRHFYPRSQTGWGRISTARRGGIISRGSISPPP